MRSTKYGILSIIKVFILSIAILTTAVIPTNLNILCPETVQAAQKVKISKTKLTITEGKNEYLSLLIDGCQLVDNGYAIKWSSSNKKVVTVNKLGKIKGISQGTAIISAKYKFNKKTYKCKVTVKPAFNAKEAKEKITFTPVSIDNTLYRVTSTYEFPTLIKVDYKIIDKDGVTIIKSFEYVVATAWGDSYIKMPLCDDNTTMQLSYSYTECRGISKNEYESLKNSIQICKFEKNTGMNFVGNDKTGYFVYDVYIKNISNKKIRGDIGFLIYDDKGELLPYQANSQINVNLDPNETIKETISVLQEIKNKVHPLEDLTNVGDIKFYVAGL